MMRALLFVAAVAVVPAVAAEPTSEAASLDADATAAAFVALQVLPVDTTVRLVCVEAQDLVLQYREDVTVTVPVEEPECWIELRVPLPTGR